MSGRVFVWQHGKDAIDIVHIFNIDGHYIPICCMPKHYSLSVGDGKANTAHERNITVIENGGLIWIIVFQLIIRINIMCP